MDRADSRPARYAPDTVAWSPDGTLLAWIATGGDTGCRHYVRGPKSPGHHAPSLSRPDLCQTGKDGWNATAGADYYGIFLPKYGIDLIKPTGDATGDRLIVPYHALVEGLPFVPDLATDWQWQPWPD